jgi:NAD(P)-dependent dehydrogenase (short-subunit alcohol dehydrogenase family)
MRAEDFMPEFIIGPTLPGRIAKSGDVAKAVLFLASDDAELITGRTLNVSGAREMY